MTLKLMFVVVNMFLESNIPVLIIALSVAAGVILVVGIMICVVKR